MTDIQKANKRISELEKALKQVLDAQSNVEETVEQDTSAGDKKRLIASMSKANERLDKIEERKVDIVEAAIEAMAMNLTGNQRRVYRIISNSRSILRNIDRLTMNL